jgi:peptidoglycan hydrolase CwlO-like protein
VENKSNGIIIVLVIGLIALCVFLYGHYQSAGTADGRSAISTMEQLKQNNKSAMDDNITARGNISSAQDKIQSAQSELDRANANIDNARQSVSELQRTNNDNTTQLDAISGELDKLDASIRESKQNVTTERSIVSTVENANKTNGTSR